MNKLEVGNKYIDDLYNVVTILYVSNQNVVVTDGHRENSYPIECTRTWREYIGPKEMVRMYLYAYQLDTELQVYHGSVYYANEQDFLDIHNFNCSWFKRLDYTMIEVEQ